MNQIINTNFAQAVTLLLLCLWGSSTAATQAQTTAFTYQGKLTDAGNPANGTYDLQFRLFDALGGGNQVGMILIREDVAVSSGIFTVLLDFGASAFPGANRWLEIAVRPGVSTGGFTALSPLQPVMATPYAIKSLNATAADGLSATCVGCVTGAQIGSLPTNSSSYIHNALTLQANSNFNISGNGTLGGALTANALASSALRQELTAYTPNIINGFLGTGSGGAMPGNRVTVGVVGAIIGGGGYNGTIMFPSLGVTLAGDNSNRVTDWFGTIGGGVKNRAGNDDVTLDNASWATVGGGQENRASSIAATVGGGLINTASSSYATVSGGQSNTASLTWATVGGGGNNTASGTGATVGGGYGNIASATSATVASGFGNTASGDSATVSGGFGNTASGGSATVSGGDDNGATGFTATVGGGGGNTASGGYATVGGGSGNTAGRQLPTDPIPGDYSTVAGGRSNKASGDYATVAGGFFNTASGNYSFAAGRRAIAQHEGVFVWADSTDANFGSLAANQFLIRASGGVGIGTETPARALHVQHSADGYEARFGRSTSVHLDISGNQLTSFNGSGGGATLYFNFSNNGHISMAAGGGNVGIGQDNPLFKLHVNGCINATNIACASDARLKTKITELRYGLSHLLQLRPVSWHWKDAAMNQLPLGLIAQEVEPVLPELILRGNEPTSPLGLNYLGLVPIVVKAIQEQQATIQQQERVWRELRTENDTLKQQLATHEARFNHQQQQLDALKKLVCQTNPQAAACQE